MDFEGDTFRDPKADVAPLESRLLVSQSQNSRFLDKDPANSAFA